MWRGMACVREQGGWYVRRRAERVQSKECGKRALQGSTASQEGLREEISKEDRHEEVLVRDIRERRGPPPHRNRGE